ncbi:MAG: GAF domain-containing sensor histidine kinase [Chloroflexota bacterium]|nr:GAF domain-containing sensor histidine kinase [Chloroflexota bacterium]
MGIDDLAGTAARVAGELSGAAAARLWLAERPGGAERPACSWPGDWPAAGESPAAGASVPLAPRGAFSGGRVELLFPVRITPAEDDGLLRILATHLAAAFDAFYRRAREELAPAASDIRPDWPSNADELSTRLIRRVLHLCHADCGSFLLVDRDLDRLTMNVCVQGTPADGHRQGHERCMLCWPSRGGFVARSTDQPPALIGEVGAGRRYAIHTRAVMSTPMYLNGKFFGVISLGHSQPGAFNGAHLQLLSSLADAVAASIHSIQGWLDAQALALMSERNRIAQEIHDGVAQDLAFLAISAESAAALPEKAGETLREMRGYLLRDIEELRRAIHALQPVDVEKLGLELALRRLVAAFGRRHGLEASLDVDTPLPNLERAMETAIFHTAQEALANVAKHAQARSVQLRLQSGSGDGLLLEVADDGRGFSESELSGPSDLGGLGLERMRERVELLGGAVEIRSAPGSGTRLRIQLPARP